MNENEKREKIKSALFDAEHALMFEKPELASRLEEAWTLFEDY